MRTKKDTLKEGETRVLKPLFFDGGVLQLERIIDGKLVKWTVPVEELLQYVFLLSPTITNPRSRK